MRIYPGYDIYILCASPELVILLLGKCQEIRRADRKNQLEILCRFLNDERPHLIII